MVSSSHISKVDSSKCKACGVCVEVCSLGLFSIVDKEGKLFSEIRAVKDCIRCGNCIKHCENRAIIINGSGRRVTGVDRGLCVACEQCSIVCPEQNFEIAADNGKFFSNLVCKDKCLGDHNCVFVCKQNAIKY